MYYSFIFEADFQNNFEIPQLPTKIMSKGKCFNEITESEIFFSTQYFTNFSLSQSESKKFK
jgi:hypothetical protein